MSVGFGIGGGGGEGKGKGGNGVQAMGEGEGVGAGGGAGMSPVGFLATKGGEIQFISTKGSKGIGTALEKIPDILEKFMDSKKQDTSKA
ncbi:hypothetical protein GCM10023093_00870 [Nemorincola caseinilytica]|uniref:Sporulation protein YtfJ n=1 Tax=Nemorincola caseinilytica TaxID=2054315 RepID=A0ABP8N516_9BACT